MIWRHCVPNVTFWIEGDSQIVVLESVVLGRLRIVANTKLESYYDAQAVGFHFQISVEESIL